MVLECPTAHGEQESTAFEHALSEILPQVAIMHSQDPSRYVEVYPVSPLDCNGPAKATGWKYEEVRWFENAESSILLSEAGNSSFFIPVNACHPCRSDMPISISARTRARSVCIRWAESS